MGLMKKFLKKNRKNNQAFPVKQKKGIIDVPIKETPEVIETEPVTEINDAVHDEIEKTMEISEKETVYGVNEENSKEEKSSEN